MDFLDFESEQLYFDEALDDSVKEDLDEAAQAYGDSSAETALMRAYKAQPEHPMVLVALYRYYYYQHRLADALDVADRVLEIYARRLGLPLDWQELNDDHVQNLAETSMTMIRFYLLALKGAGYLELRLGINESAMARLEKVAELDTSDRLGAKALIEVANDVLNHAQTVSA